MQPLVRDEQAGDEQAISAITQAAFRGMPHSQQTEAAIVLALRAAGALTVSLVAVEARELVGHVAFSPITINAAPAPDWYGLGPLSVRPERQRRGIGSALVRAGLERLRVMNARGCVLVGDPAWYGRFGFVAGAGLCCAGVEPRYFQVLALGAAPAQGVVGFHPAFFVQAVSVE